MIYILIHNPVHMILEFNSLLNSEATTEDVRIGCEDLKVLGKKDFKVLLRWRLEIRELVGFIVFI